MINNSKILGLRHITVYAFSTENWKRSREEVEGLLNLLRDYLKTRKAKAKQNQVTLTRISA